MLKNGNGPSPGAAYSVGIIKNASENTRQLRAAQAQDRCARIRDRRLADLLEQLDAAIDLIAASLSDLRRAP